MVRPEGSNLEEGPNRIVHLVKAYQKLKKFCKWRGIRYVTAHVFAIALFFFQRIGPDIAGSCNVKCLAVLAIF